MANVSRNFQNVTATIENSQNIMAFYVLPGIVDANTASDVAEAVYCYILPVLVIFGTTGNVLTLVVLGAQKKKDTIMTSLTALAIADTGYIVTTFISTLMFGQVIVVNITFSRISGVITAVISTERSLAVLMPLQIRNLITKRRMAVTMVIVYICTFALIGPVFFMGKSYWTTNPITNSSYVTYAYTEWYLENKSFADVYRDIFLNIMFRFLPTVVICLNTALIIHGVRKASVWRMKKSSKDDDIRKQKEVKMNIMLLAICGIFLLCTLPGLVFQSFTYSTDQFSVFGRYRNMYKLSSAISILTQFINSSVNFIAYIFLNDRFYQTFQRLFCRKSFMENTEVRSKSGTTKNTEVSKSETS